MLKPRYIVSRQMIESTQIVIGKLRRSGNKHMRKRMVKQKANNKKWRLKKETSYPNIDQSLPGLHVYIICVRVSEFDIFAPRPVQSSVLNTTVATYKPIASVDRAIWIFRYEPMTST